MNALVLAVAGIATVGGAAGWVFLGPVGDPGTTCDSKPLEPEQGREYTLRVTLTNLDGPTGARVCIFTHEKVQKLYDSVIQVPAGATRSVDVALPSRIAFLNAYAARLEVGLGTSETQGIEDSCDSRLIEVTFEYGKHLVGGSSGECITRGTRGTT